MTSAPFGPSVVLPELVGARLGILAPDAAQTALVTARIHEMAAARGQGALILGMVSETDAKPGLRGKLAPWLGSAVVIVGFLWLRFWLINATGLQPNNGWLVGSIPVEIALIWLVNVLVAYANG